MSDRIGSCLLPAALRLTLCRNAQAGEALGNDHDPRCGLGGPYGTLIGDCRGNLSAPSRRAALASGGGFRSGRRLGQLR
jgi:hypothetical protein